MPDGVKASAGEGVSHPDAGLGEVAHVSSREGKVVNQRSRSNQTVLDRHGLICGPKVGEKFGPAQSCSGVPRYTNNSRDAFLEPTIEPLTAFAAGKEKNAEPDFA